MGCGSSTQTGGEQQQQQQQPQQQQQEKSTEKTTTTTNTTQNNNASTEEPKAKDSTTAVSPYIEEALKAHNELRAKHGAPPLTHAQDLTDYSQAWADKIAAKGQMEHSNCKHTTGPVGENIAWSSADGPMASAQGSVQMWYDEIKDYNYDKPGFAMGTGHFTQVVWKDSKELGIARAVSKDGSVFTVANYRPAGNFTNMFPQNVLPPL